jgi:hypothetical protein
VDNMLSSNGVIQWNVFFVRSVQDWEVVLVLAFFEELYSFRRRQGSDDYIWWIPSKRKKFEVSLFFQELSNSGGGVILFLGGVFGKLKSPLRVRFFFFF